MSSSVHRRPNDVDVDAVVAVVVVERAHEPVARWPVPRAGTCVHLGHVDTVATLALAAHRLGCEARLEGADPELLELLDLVGLRREVVGQAECREQPGVELEEAVVADDPLG